MRQRTLLILLFVSLAVNLFVVGALVGALVLGARLHGLVGRGPRLGGPPMAVAARVLSPDQAQAFRQMLREEASAVGPKIRQARQLRRDALGRLAGEPLDPQPILRDLGSARALEAEARGEVDQRIVEFAARLPADQRARLGEALAHPPHRGPAPPAAR
jgi:uncharacterized membrane protein